MDIDSPPGKLDANAVPAGVDRDRIQRGFRDGKQLVFGMAILFGLLSGAQPFELLGGGYR